MEDRMTQEKIMGLLSEVLCPGTKVDIVKIKLVGEVSITDDVATVNIVQTSERDELIGEVCKLVEAKLGDADITAKVMIKDNKPQKKKPQSDDPWADRAGLPGVKKIIAVASGKGGVGKSTVAVNLALGLLENGFKVGILDADVYGPSLTTMLAIIESPVSEGEGKIKPVMAKGLQCISMGMLVPEGQALIWRGPMVMAAIKQFLKDVMWKDLDYLIVDMPPGTGDAQLTLVQQVPVDGVLMVTTPQEIALADVRRGVQMFNHTKTPVAGIVENMSYFACPCCDEKSDIFGSGGGEEVSDQFGIPLLGQLPIDPAIRAGGDNGQPAALQMGTASRKAFLELAKAVAEKVPV
jgi:ATP-binding protein involved in chromosome partitioning